MNNVTITIVNFGSKKVCDFHNFTKQAHNNVKLTLIIIEKKLLNNLFLT